MSSLSVTDSTVSRPLSPHLSPQGEIPTHMPRIIISSVQRIQHAFKLQRQLSRLKGNDTVYYLCGCVVSQNINDQK